MRKTILGIGKLMWVDMNNPKDIQRVNWEIMSSILLGITLGIFIGATILWDQYRHPIILGTMYPVVLLTGSVTVLSLRRFRHCQEQLD